MPTSADTVFHLVSSSHRFIDELLLKPSVISAAKCHQCAHSFVHLSSSPAHHMHAYFCYIYLDLVGTWLVSLKYTSTMIVKLISWILLFHNYKISIVILSQVTTNTNGSINQDGHNSFSQKKSVKV